MKKKIICVNIFHPRDHTFYTNLLKNLNYLDIIFIIHLEEPLKKNKKIKYINFYQKNYLEEFKNINPRINTNDLLHEKITFGKNLKELQTKYKRYYQKYLNIIKKNKINLFVQEIGGLVAHFSSYKACKHLKVDHLFIEPGIIASHSIFLLNSNKIQSAVKIVSNKEAIKTKNIYVNKVLKNNIKVHNFKDNHFYNKNIFNIIFKRYYYYALFRKIRNYLMGYRSEFPNALKYIFTILCRIFNAINNINYNYKSNYKSKNYFYFPLHAPNDFALSIRAPKFLDQINSIKKKVINNSLYSFVLKEHPMAAYNYNYKKIENKIKKSFFVNHNTTSIEIIKNSKFLITINSKSGIEALVLGIPVFCLQNSYYCGKGLAFIKSKVNISAIIEKLDKYMPNKKAVDIFLKDIFAKTAFFDLYNNNSNSLKKSRLTFKKILTKI